MSIKRLPVTVKHADGVDSKRQNVRSCAPQTTVIVDRLDVRVG